MTTTDLSQFGRRELAEAAKLLEAWSNNKFPDDFDADGVQLMMNQNSGNVFLTNSDCQVAMLNGNDLESFYSSPYEGREGFFDDLLEEYPEMHREDQEWFKEIAENLNREDELPEEDEDEDEEEEEENETETV